LGVNFFLSLLSLSFFLPFLLQHCTLCFISFWLLDRSSKPPRLGRRLVIATYSNYCEITSSIRWRFLLPPRIQFVLSCLNLTTSFNSGFYFILFSVLVHLLVSRVGGGRRHACVRLCARDWLLEQGTASRLLSVSIADAHFVVGCWHDWKNCIVKPQWKVFADNKVFGPISRSSHVV
jgi:hypothetical protein